MRPFRISSWLALLSITVGPLAAQSIQQQLAQLALQTDHFATQTMIANRWPYEIEQNLTAKMLRKQEALKSFLDEFHEKRPDLAECLKDPDPKIRTLALAALFVREDAHDLPLIASLLNDDATTFPDLINVPDRVGPASKADYERPQKVGDVAQAMIRYYLESAGVRMQRSQTGSNAGARVADLPAAFNRYWELRKDRSSCASWYLVKLRRATQEKTPLQDNCQADIQRVLAEIKGLPPVTRAWTMLFIRSQTHYNISFDIWPRAELVAAMKAPGPGALMDFVQGKRATDDPDFRAGSMPPEAAGYILWNARALLRPEDADALVRDAFAERPGRNDSAAAWIAAAGRLKSVRDPEEAGEFLRSSLAQFPLLGGDSGWENQDVLMLTLWEIRGAKEKEFLTNWFYTMSATAPSNGMTGTSSDFILGIASAARPDTAELIAALAADPRFEKTEWHVLVQFIKIVNASLPTPLIDQGAVWQHNPQLHRQDQEEKLAEWRNLIRKNYGINMPGG